MKRGEAALGAPLGLHGAFYAIRRSAWAALPPDTINDDFILPLEIFGRGWPSPTTRRSLPGKTRHAIQPPICAAAAASPVGMRSK